MARCIIFFLVLACFLSSQENVFWSDLQQVFQTNIKSDDSTFKASISRMRKLFYDSTIWDMLIPSAQKYLRPNDATSLGFFSKYRSGVIIFQQEDFGHVLGALDGYLNVDKTIRAEEKTPTKSVDTECRSLTNADWCSWLGDTASALAESYKHNIPLETAFANYAGDADLRANIIAFYLAKISLPYENDLEKFPIVEICKKSYWEWQDSNARHQIMLVYCNHLGLVWCEETQEFTPDSRQKFLKDTLVPLKSAALAYYYGTRHTRWVTFKDQDAQKILELFLHVLARFAR